VKLTAGVKKRVVSADGTKSVENNALIIWGFKQGM